MSILNILKEKSKLIGKAFGIMLIYFGGMVIFSSLFNKCLTSSNAFISSCTNLLIYILVLLICSLFFIPTLIDSFYNLKKENIKIAFKNWGLGFICMFVSNLYLTYFIGNIASNEQTNRAFLESNPLIAIILMVFIAPALEEVVFRLNLKQAFKNKYVFCVFSALLFGGMHLLSASSLKELLYIIPYGSLGFFFAKAYYETDNIYTSIFAHSFHNGLSVAIIMLGMALI